MKSQESSKSGAPRIPSRFPVGTRYVVEGRGGLIQLRYLVFPDGRQVILPPDRKERAVPRAGQERLRRNRSRAA